MDVQRQHDAVTSVEPAPNAPTIELRLARSDDNTIVRQLSALDCARSLKGDVVIAFCNGAPVAGLSLVDQRVVADPFVETQDAVALLRLRAEHLSRATHARRGRRRLHPRKPRYRLGGAAHPHTPS